MPAPGTTYISAKRYRAFTAEWSEEDDEEFEEDNFEVEDLDNIQYNEIEESATKKRSRETDDDEDRPEGEKSKHTSAV